MSIFTALDDPPCETLIAVVKRGARFYLCLEVSEKRVQTKSERIRFILFVASVTFQPVINKTPILLDYQ